MIDKADGQCKENSSNWVITNVNPMSLDEKESQRTILELGRRKISEPRHIPREKFLFMRNRKEDALHERPIKLTRKRAANLAWVEAAGIALFMRTTRAGQAEGGRVRMGMSTGARRRTEGVATPQQWQAGHAHAVPNNSTERGALSNWCQLSTGRSARRQTARVPRCTERGRELAVAGRAVVSGARSEDCSTDRRDGDSRRRG